MNETALRRQLANSLAWGDAHVAFEKVVARFPARLRGVVPAGMAHSAWQLLEHMRLAQADLLEFCVSARYKAKAWPADYWPASAAPKTDGAWAASVVAFRRDRRALQRLCANRDVDLLAPVPSGERHQTYLREFLLIIDHSAYHLGQLLLVRRALGKWPD